MSLKSKITKEVFEKLADGLKAEYKVNANDVNEYVLDVEGLEDTGALKRAKDRETETAKAEKIRADKAEADLAEFKKSGARNTGDIVALEKSWKEQADAKEATAKAETKVVKQKLAKVMRDDVALQIATRISTKPNLILPHVMARLKAEIPDDGDPLTRVLDKEGKPSALTISQLEQEFIADADFAGIIVASRASGGGASGDQNRGGASKKPSEYSQAERVALQKDNPSKFTELFPPVL